MRTYLFQNIFRSLNERADELSRKVDSGRTTGAQVQRLRALQNAIMYLYEKNEKYNQEAIIESTPQKPDDTLIKLATKQVKL